MSWTYRVIRREESELSIVAIHEVYDMDDGVSWTANPVWPSGDNVDDLRVDLERMLAALDSPVMVEDGNSLVEEVTSAEQEIRDGK